MVSNAIGRDTNEVNPVCVWMFPDVVRQVSAMDPFGNQLERSRSDPKERNDVLVFRTFPNYGLLVEALQTS